MRSSHLAVSLLVLFIFLSSVQGIRLERTFRPAGHHMQEPGASATALMKNSKGVMKDANAIRCKQGHCSTGKGRKLFSTATTSATESKAYPISTLKSAVNEENVGKQEKFHDQYVEIMDYSPARRKTPIHN